MGLKTRQPERSNRAMKNTTLSVVVVLLGCASIETPPRPADLPEVFRVGGVEPQSAWSRTTSVLMQHGFAIATSDRAGGVLRTEWMKMKSEQDALMLCGTNAVGDRLRIRGEHAGWSRVNIAMYEEGSDLTFRIQPEYQIWWGVTSPDDPRDFNALAICQTTGELERALVAAVEGR